MSYIKNQEHLANYIRKIVKETSGYNPHKLLSVNLYIQHGYEFRDELAWAVKNDVTILEEENFWEWLRQKKIGGFAFPEEVDQITTTEFHETLDELVDIPGVYSFWNEKDTCLYIGVSRDLSSRIASSFTHRFKHYTNLVMLKTIATKTASDAAVLEALLIAAYKPVLNKTGKFNDNLTLPYQIPEFDKPIPCNVPGEKVYVRVERDVWRTRLSHAELDSEELEQDPTEKKVG